MFWVYCGKKSNMTAPYVQRKLLIAFIQQDLIFCTIGCDSSSGRAAVTVR